MLTHLSSLFSSRGWCWRAPPPRRSPTSSRSSTRPSSPATPLTPPSPVRYRKRASITGRPSPPQPKSPVRTERPGSAPRFLQSGDKVDRSKPKRSQRPQRRQTARRATSQPLPHSAFSPLRRVAESFLSHICHFRTETSCVICILSRNMFYSCSFLRMQFKSDCWNPIRADSNQPCTLSWDNHPVLKLLWYLCCWMWTWYYHWPECTLVA